MLLVNYVSLSGAVLVISLVKARTTITEAGFMLHHHRDFGCVASYIILEFKRLVTSSTMNFFSPTKILTYPARFFA